MKLLAAVRMALGALRAHALRTTLTMLGIIIGVAAVIAMVSVGAGAQSQPHRKFVLAHGMPRK